MVISGGGRALIAHMIKHPEQKKCIKHTETGSCFVSIRRGLISLRFIIIVSIVVIGVVIESRVNLPFLVEWIGLEFGLINLVSWFLKFRLFVLVGLQGFLSCLFSLFLDCPFVEL